MTGRIDRLKKEYEISVLWRAYPLHPDTPEEGLLIAQLFPNHSMEDVQKMMYHVRQTAENLGLPFGDREKTFNSRLAQELGKWAESKGRGDRFHAAAFNAYFAEGKNIAQRPVLLDLAESAGLPRDEALTVLETRAFKDDVDRDWALSQRTLITAVPTFVMTKGKLVGAQPYEMLEEMMAACGVGKRNGP